jgi:beta-lactamase regulating signal transducer with metallopeptidase domain
MIMFDPLTVSAIALKTSLLVVGIGLIALLTARQSAARRHFLWTSALVLSLLMPIAIVYLPSWVEVSLPPAAAQPWSRDESALVTAGARQADTQSAVPLQRQEASSTEARQTRASWPTLMIVWVVGALGVLLRNALAHVGLMRWVRQSRPDLCPAWAATLRRVAGEAQFRQPVRVLESDHATSPCTFGFLRPVVLLPAVGAAWPEPQRRFTLLHELAHVRRLDYLTTQVSTLACAMHWYNPLIWFAAVQARKLQEQACDDVVLNAGGMPSDYAQFLVSIAGGPRRVSLAFPAAIGMVQRSQLHGRVTAILDVSRARVSLGGLALVVALTPNAGLMLILATLSDTSSPVSIHPPIQ